MLDVQVKAGEDVNSMNIPVSVKTDVDEAHLKELRHIASAMADEDAEVTLEVLVTKYPFTTMDILKDYFKDMKNDLGNIRKVFIDRDARKKEILGGDK